MKSSSSNVERSSGARLTDAGLRSLLDPVFLRRFKALHLVATSPSFSGVGPVLLACLASAGVLLSSCSQTSSPPAPRLVVLYLPCTVNKSYLAPYDDAVNYTPNLSAFSRQALVFDNHVTEAGLSGVAYASIFSGSHAPSHGVYTHPKHIPDSLYLITEAFADNGYETFFWVTQPMARASLNDQGVDQDNVIAKTLVADDPTLVEILARLDREDDYKALVISAFTVTHAPYSRRSIDGFCRKYPEECGARRDAKEFDDYADLYLENYLELSYDYAQTAERLELSKRERRKLGAVVELMYKSNIYRLDRMFGAVVESIEDHGLTDESLVLFRSLEEARHPTGFCGPLTPDRAPPTTAARELLPAEPASSTYPQRISTTERKGSSSSSTASTTRRRSASRSSTSGVVGAPPSTTSGSSSPFRIPSERNLRNDRLRTTPASQARRSPGCRTRVRGLFIRVTQAS